MTGLLVALGAAMGAPARYLLDVLLRARFGAGFPWGTLLANVTGSFALGLLTGAGVGGAPAALLGTGFCGAFTTYSAFAWDSTHLPRRRAALNVAANLGLGLAAAAAGRTLTGGA